MISYQGRSGALELKKINVAMAINVQAPPDITIHIRNQSRCDTSILIPAATFSGNCSPNLTFQTSSTYGNLTTNGGIFYFTPGVFKVYFSIEDDCRMSGLDSMTVTVHDAQLPQVVCAPAQTISINESGIAEAPAYLFDGGSSDNCNHLYFKIKRMFASSVPDCLSPANPDNAFDDLVRFCCADADSQAILLILRVYDVYPGPGPVSDSLLRGRYVDCMVQALVNDKIAPELECPPDFTVQCGVHLDSLLSKGVIHYFDNCGISNIDTSDENNLDACGSGTFIRTYIATDRHGLNTTCRQTITVYRSHTFDGLNPAHLTWPLHTTVYACRIDLDTIQSGYPVINDDACALVQVTKNDEIFHFNHGGVCAKVLRKWKVIDWCKYNPLFQPHPYLPANGYYTYTQEIKVFDTIAPVLFGIQDTIVGIQTPNCEPGQVNLPSVGATDCGSNDKISFRFEVDYHGDLSIDQTGKGPNASGVYPVGRHIIYYYAKDSCHNEGQLQVILEVQDSKIPYAIAMFGVSSSLTQMPNGPMTIVPARLFNNKSSDNCTDDKNLRFSYSSDINDTLRVYTCDSQGRRDIKLVVWDEAGNSSEVYTFLVIDDVFSHCPTGLKPVKLEGRILTQNGQPVKEVEVKLSTLKTDKTSQTSNDGSFIFSDIPASAEAHLYSSHSKNYSEGLSTADIILIQRHILGIELFDEPSKFFAADMDMNRSVSTKDVVLLRNLILGRDSNLLHNKSYIFLNPNYVFKDPKDPFYELDSCQDLMLEELYQDTKINIKAVKLGDVNLSFTAHGYASGDYFESEEIFYRIKDNILEFYLNQPRDLTGLQIGMELKGLCLNQIQEVQSDLPEWNPGNYYKNNNCIKISYHSVKGISINSYNPLFKIKFENRITECIPFPELMTGFKSELYTNHSVVGINDFESEAKSGDANFYILNFLPNPFTDKIQIGINGASESQINIEVLTPEQRSISCIPYGLQKGANVIALDRKIFGNPGVYFIKISNGTQIKLLKVIAI